MTTEMCMYWQRQQFRDADEHGFGMSPYTSQASAERAHAEQEEEDEADPPCGECVWCLKSACDDAYPEVEGPDPQRSKQAQQSQQFFDELNSPTHEQMHAMFEADDAYWGELRGGDHNDVDADVDASALTHPYPYHVNLWGSHPDDDNDDCWTGSSFRTLEEAHAAFDDPWRHARTRHLRGWLRSFRSTTYIQLDGPGICEVRMMPDPLDDTKWKARMDRERVLEDERCEAAERRERAMEAGMCMGIDPWGEVMGCAIDNESDDAD
jgi:hypothetical protein